MKSRHMEETRKVQASAMLDSLGDYRSTDIPL